MTKLSLHPYQVTGTNEVARLTQFHRTIIRQLNTGGGKTVEFSSIAYRYTQANPGKSVLILVHREELLMQTRQRAYEFFRLRAQPIVAGMKFIPEAPVYVGMAQSTHLRYGLLPDNIGMVIIDECHEGIFKKIHKHFFDNTKAYIIGFTATPKTVSKKDPLKNYYEAIVPGPQVRELIEIGKLFPEQGLVQNITYAPKDVVDRAALTVASDGNDYDINVMGEQFRKPRYVDNTVNQYKQKAEGRKAIVFNVNIEHSIAVRDAFLRAGYDCRHIDSSKNTTKEYRRETFEWFKNTPGAILCNVGIAQVGLDEPSIECVIMNLATMSLVRWLQCVGRGGRRFLDIITAWLKENFIVIDMGGNAITHGDWCDDRDWIDEFNNPAKPGKGGGVAPVKICPNCVAVVPAQIRVCEMPMPEGGICGYEFPEKSIPIEVDMKEFTLFTKNINVDTLLKEYPNRNDFLLLFEIGKQIARAAKQTTVRLNDERVEFILHEYEREAKVWFEAINEERKRRRVFSAKTKERIKDFLYSELERLYPGWKRPKVEAMPMQPTQRETAILNSTLQIKFGEPIKNIQNLKSEHYE